MKTYEAEFDLENNKGVYMISLVEDPAMEGNFIALSKDSKIELKTLDEEQRIIMGLVLEPNKPIYRNQDGEEFNIVFSENVIKELSHNFFKQGFQTNSTIEHEDSITGVSFVESWIVEDPKIDKSANFGMSYPKGSWIATMKVDNDEIWNDYVKTGKVLGFSVDAFVTLKEVKLNKNKSMINEIKDAISEGFKAFTAELKAENVEEIKLGSVSTSDGVVIMFDGEMLEQGAAVWIQGEDDVKVALPIGEYALEDGKVLVVSEEGMAGELKDALAEPAPAAAEELADEAPTASSVTEEIKSAIKSVLIKYTAEFDAKLENVKTEFSDLKKENDELKNEVVELGKQPVSKSIKSLPTQIKANTAKGRLTQFLNNNK